MHPSGPDPRQRHGHYAERRSNLHGPDTRFAPTRGSRKRRYYSSAGPYEPYDAPATRPLAYGDHLHGSTYHESSGQFLGTTTARPYGDHFFVKSFGSTVVHLQDHAYERRLAHANNIFAPQRTQQTYDSYQMPFFPAQGSAAWPASVREGSPTSIAGKAVLGAGGEGIRNGLVDQPTLSQTESSHNLSKGETTKSSVPPDKSPIDCPESFSRSPLLEKRPLEEYEDRQSCTMQSADCSASSKAYQESFSPSFSGKLGPRTYQYRPLEDSSIRLVRVLPEKMWKLKCEIVHVSLYHAPKYHAISYAWGDGIDTKSLIVEGATIPVAASLHDALRAVRRKREDILVWIDALCIDQQNKEERAAQVRLMGKIYSTAESVDVWIGPEDKYSALVIPLLQKIAQKSIALHISSLQETETSALLKIFKRDYWERLWVVQEALLAKEKSVYCGSSKLPWKVYEEASNILWDKDSDPHVRRGPSSFPNLSILDNFGDESLLEIMRSCRKKLSENPRDKVFGILGLLTNETQQDFPVDYNQPVKVVFIDVVDYLISSTSKLDVIREAIHFPLHVNSVGLPSWCPDWSHIPEVSGLGRIFNFAASNSANGVTVAQYSFHDERRKLEISAIGLGVVQTNGVAVGTFCAGQDYLTAFHQWRAVLLQYLGVEGQDNDHPAHAAFCRTLCLGQVPPRWNHGHAWRDLCFHLFAALTRSRLPHMAIDVNLTRQEKPEPMFKSESPRKFLQDHFGNRMMGRTLCIVQGGLIGMGSGYLVAGDVVVVPFGCSTPIVLRPEDYGDEYRYIGDVYVDGYMHGEAVAEMEAGDPRRVVSKYMLC